MKPAHTPGPWYQAEVDFDICGRHSDGRGFTTRVYADRISREEVAANARLIAAAPSLLTELRETLADLQSWDGTPDALEIIKENIRAAIEKAEGKP